jgi:aspartate racemase
VKRGLGRGAAIAASVFDGRPIIVGVARLLGIVGGTGPESTVDYYRRLVATWRERRPDGSYPRVIINSVEAGRIFGWLASGEYERIGADVADAVDELAAAGAGIALIASNATHLGFPWVAARSPIPLIHIVDTARDRAVADGRHRLAIFGTRFMMEGRLYPERFEPAGIAVVAPGAAERDEIHQLYFGELVKGIVRDETRARFVEILAEMRDRDDIDGLILGGTELALILTEPSYAGVPVLNTAQVHVDAAVDWLLDDGAEPAG